MKFFFVKIRKIEKSKIRKFEKVFFFMLKFKMSELQVVSSSRSRKVVLESPVQEEVQTPLAGPLPLSVAPSEGVDVSQVIDRVEKDYVVAVSKEVQAEFRKNIKVKIVRKGRVAAYSEVLGYVPSLLQKVLEENDQYDEEQEFGSRLSAQDTVALFVTLSPEPGSATIFQMHDSMKRISVKKGIVCMFWVLENYGGKGQHPHVHALILLDKTVVNGERGKMKSTVVRILKGYRTKSDAYLDIKPVSEKSYQKKLDYIVGKKYDKDKMKLVEQDRLWRRELGLSDYYVYPEDYEKLS